MQVLADGRVRRSRSEWRAIMKAFEKSGLTISAFCEREAISRSAFADWKRRLGKTVPREPRFVELTPPPRPSPAALPAGGEFELSLPGGVTLRWKA